MLWWLIAGSRGGDNRARIITLLHDRPLNAHQITEALGLNYKTVRHHLKVLHEHDIVMTMGRGKYGAMYFLTPSIEKNYDTFEDIWGQIGQKDIKTDGNEKGEDI